MAKSCRYTIKKLLVLFIVSGFALSESDARPFRVDLIPNGYILSCNTCHVALGGPRNVFGKAVEVLVAPGEPTPFWGPEFAALDSDGDGFTNGRELQNPNGTWKPGDPNPGDAKLVSNPGDNTSVPPITAPTPTPTPLVPSGRIRIQLELIAAGLSSPVAGANPGDGSHRLFINEQMGRIRVIKNDVLLPTPFLDITNKVVQLYSGYDERGLLGLAFHPRYKENGRFFVYYSRPGGDGDHTSVVAEYRVSTDNADIADPASERVILTISEPEPNHNGGNLVFGPAGMLYIGVGDGGGGGDQHGATGNGQNLETLLGKILRIDVDSAQPYSIPFDNPFVEKAGRDEIWAYGLRNPWKFSFDRAENRRLFCGDVGQNLWEEVDIIVGGGNYGWRVMEGNHCYNPGSNCDMTGKILPINEYSHSVGESITGGYVYRGTQYRSLYGKYVFGDWSGKLFYLTETTPDQWIRQEFYTNNQNNSNPGFYILSFVENESGELYVLGNTSSGPAGTGGTVHRITVPGDEPVSIFDWKRYEKD